MKKTRILIALVLCVLAVFALASCKGGSKNSYKMTKVDMSLEDACAKVTEAGCTPVVVTIYDENNDDGAVLSVGEFTGKADNGYVTVAVNDLSIKEKVLSQPVAPRILPKESYESKIFEKISADESLKKTFESFYTLKDAATASEREVDVMKRAYPITNTEAVYVLDTGVSAKELATIDGYIKEKTEYTAEDMFNDYIAVGIVPTPNENLKSEVLSADNCEFEEIEGGVKVTLYNGEAQSIVVPAEIDGKPVVTIADGAIPQSTLHAFTTVSGLEVIEAEACSNAFGLLNITLSDTILDLGKDAFENVLFTETDGDFVTFADEILLSYTGSAAEVAVPEGIRFVGAESFLENEALTKITLPEGVQSIGNAAFKLCENVTEYNIPSTTLKICDSAFQGIRHITALHIPDSVIEIGNYAFHESNDVVEFSLGQNVKKIGDNAFEYLHLITSLDIPDSVEYLGNGAFLKCKEIATVTGGAGLKFVGTDAFGEVKWLIDLAEDYNYLADGILIKVGINEPEIIVPAEVKCISGAFNGKKKLTKIVINDGCTAITKSSFTDCAKLTDVTIPASVTYIDAGAFDMGAFANMTFHVEAGSVAEQFAKDNHIKFDNNI
ncbi:MAG: leucine-rich repeat domain-containing protein [Clostridia bacterium]|nr:leucine-rich repeat domain-containing protein [Clostridia bacterium]